MDKGHPNHLSYLLRLYPVRDGEQLIWRVSLEDPLTRVRKGFPDFASLIAFLETQAGRAEGDPSDPETGADPPDDQEMSQQRSTSHENH